MLTELTIKEFIHKVISNDPVPGGEAYRLQ